MSNESPVEKILEEFKRKTKQVRHIHGSDLLGYFPEDVVFAELEESYSLGIQEGIRRAKEEVERMPNSEKVCYQDELVGPSGNANWKRKGRTVSECPDCRTETLERLSKLEQNHERN